MGSLPAAPRLRRRPRRRLGIWSSFGSVGIHLVLPAGTILLVSIGGWVLGMRNTMIAVLAEDYVTMAEAKGLSQRRIMFAYAARNALLPNVTAFGMALGFVLSGALVTEIVFSYPGLGYQLLNAVRSLDYPLMQGLFLMITLAVLAANLIVDLLYVRLDPARADALGAERYASRVSRRRSHDRTTHGCRPASGSRRRATDGAGRDCRRSRRTRRRAQPVRRRR